MFSFCPDTHTYRIGGRPVPSPTEVIGAIMPLFQADPYYLTRGAAIHHGCALDDMGKLDWDSVSPEIEGRILAWRKFRRDWPASVVMIERPLASERYQFAGTPDRVFERDGKLVLCDLKSSISDQVKVQLGFYSLLLAEDGLKIDSAVAVELKESEEYRCLWIDSRELRNVERVALAALTVFNFMTKHSLKGERNVNGSR